jgi:hypothetical protein
MRNDARRERRLPGFFDREVYDILEGRGAAGNAVAAALEDVEEGKEEEEAKAVLRGSRGVQGSGLFSSSEDEDDQEDDAATPSPTPTPTPAPAAVAVPIPGEQAIPFFLEMARASSLSVPGEPFVPFLLLLLDVKLSPFPRAMNKMLSLSSSFLEVSM